MRGRLERKVDEEGVDLLVAHAEDVVSEFSEDLLHVGLGLVLRLRETSKYRMERESRAGDRKTHLEDAVSNPRMRRNVTPQQVPHRIRDRIQPFTLQNHMLVRFRQRLLVLLLNKLHPRAAEQTSEPQQPSRVVDEVFDIEARGEEA